MFNISANGIITIARGDCAKLEFKVNFGTKLHPDIANWIDIIDREGKPKEADERLKDAILYFGVCEHHQPFENALICKKYTKVNSNKNGNIEIVFNTKDTEFLMPGTYYYEVKLLYGCESGDESGDEKCINTLQKRTKFIIVD